MKSEVDQIKLLLNKPSQIVIFTHVNPDGDAMGSMMGLYHYLVKLGQKVTPITPNEFPFFLKWLKGTENIQIYEKSPQKVMEIIHKAQIIFCVDFNDLRRLQEMETTVMLSNAKKILIDHHPNPSNIFDYYIHRTDASAAAELIYDFIVEAEDEKIIDHIIAECIYAGIMSDTNSFNYNINDASTFKKIANLLSYQISHSKIFNLLYDNYSYDRMRLMGYCLNKKLVILPHLHTGYIWLTQKEMNEYNFQTGDSEGFVNLPLSIKGIYISALLTEKKEHVRISFRSKGEFAVNEFSKKHFMGGGHKNASGGQINLTIEQAILHFEKILETYKDEISTIYQNFD